MLALDACVRYPAPHGRWIELGSSWSGTAWLRWLTADAGGRTRDRGHPTAGTCRIGAVNPARVSGAPRSRVGHRHCRRHRHHRHGGHAALPFTLVTELGIPAQRNADVGVLFGAGDEERLVVINPQSQTLAVYQGASVLVAPTFVDDINPNGPNRIQLVVLESSLVFIGDSLALLGSSVPPSEPLHQAQRGQSADHTADRSDGATGALRSASQSTRG